jgi:hypothetical protein
MDLRLHVARHGLAVKLCVACSTRNSTLTHCLHQTSAAVLCHPHRRSCMLGRTSSLASSLERPPVCM